MADAGQRVVFAEDRDDRPARPGLGDEGGLEPARRSTDVGPLPREIAREGVGGEALLVGELGPGMDLERQSVERVRARVDPLRDTDLQPGGVHGRPKLARTHKPT